MKTLKTLLSVVLITISSLSLAQTMTITSPVLTAPYQVVTGTVVTFKWSAMSTAPTGIYTHDSIPDATIINSGLPPSSYWTTLTNWTGPDANGDYSINITINNDTWVFGAVNGFIGSSYSNVLALTAISGLSITASDSMICPTGGSVIFTAPSGTGYSYQWHNDTAAISGATSSTYTTTTAGNYHCVITISGSPNVTNSISVSAYEASFTGALGTGVVNFTSNQTFTSYQWLERTTSGTATPISGANANMYSATISSTEMFYSLQGVTLSGCTVTSVERRVIDTLFTLPVITLNAPLNPQGYVCEGTPVSIVSSGNTGFHQWRKDGQNSFSFFDSININGVYQNGVWDLVVECSEWPEINLYSNSVVVNIYALLNTVVTGGNYYAFNCPGDIINLILTDEGYSYTWYLHDTANVYGPSDIINVPSSFYQHTFSTSKYVTIVSESNGCSKVKSIWLKSAADQNIPTSIDNYNQSYLCIDSTVNIMVPSWAVNNFTNYQWEEEISGTWTVLANETLSVLNVDHPAMYRITANPAGCSSVTATSYEYEIKSYLDRQPYIYANSPTMCEGDTIILQMSASSNWYAQQWLESYITIGSSGYDRHYVGMVNNSGTDTQEVYEYSSYQVSVKHISCPNGLKVRSNIIFVKPTLNPKIELITPFPSEPMHVIDWDSTEHFLGCMNEPVTMTLNNLNYSSIVWYAQGYTGDDDYDLGIQFSTNDTVNNLMDAKFITAVVTDANGCVGQTTPVLLDARVFNSPAVTSYNNSELCNQGDSTLMHLAFQGTWIAYEWELDGIAIPNSDNDSIWGKDTGMYVINAYPADCPTFKYSSGLGPVVKYLYSDILENDTLIYAMPELGFYTYQWFFNGDSIDDFSPLWAPWILPKDSLQNGTYTVAVSNENCTKISEAYIWDPTGLSNIIVNDLVKVYPNPTTGIVNIESAQMENISAITLTDMKGEIIFRLQGLTSGNIDISALSTGIYFLRIESRDGHIQYEKISKL